MITELEEDQIKEALQKKRLYNPYDVFTHAPDFYPCYEDSRYQCRIEIVKWNTKSTRMTVLYARFDNNKKEWIFCKKPGLKRTPHGEKMR